MIFCGTEISVTIDNSLARGVQLGNALVNSIPM